MKNNIYVSGKKEFGFLDSGIGEFVYLVIQYLIIALLYMALSLGLPRGSVVNEVASFLIEIGFLATVFIVALATKTNVFKATKLNTKPKTYQVALTAVIALIAYFGFSAMTNAFIDFLELVGYSSSSSPIVVNVWWKYLLYTFTMAAVPAFCEELLFRGLIYQGLRKWSKVGAVFISALLFMLMHGSPDQTVHQFILGIILALVFNATGSIWCPMLLHFLNNFIALTLSFIYSQAGDASVAETASESVQTYSPWTVWIVELFIAFGVATVAAFLIWTIIKSLKKQRLEEKNENKIEITKAEDGKQIVDISALSDENSVKTATETPEKTNNTIAVVLFVLAGVWVSIDWIWALVTGLLK